MFQQINFQSLNSDWSALLDHITLQFDREEVKDSERGSGWGVDYSYAINRGTAIFQGNTVHEELLVLDNMEHNIS